MSILRQKREAMGLGLVEVAGKLQLDPGNLSRIETGKQTPRLDNAKRIAAFYGVDLLTVLVHEDRAA